MEQEKDGMPLTSLREIQLLKEMKHPNVVSLLEVVVGSSLDSIYLVFEYIEHDFAALIDFNNKPFKESEIKCFLLQLLRGIEYLHSHYIIHRDLKCSNLLYSDSGYLKLADFGLARKFGYPIDNITPKVVTLWYRAPELLLGAEKYSSSVDIWSIGCIFGELLLGYPLASAKNEIDQIRQIFDLLGDPNEIIWPGFSSLPNSKKIFISSKPSYNHLHQKIPNLSKNAYDLLDKFLTYDPLKRITAAEALKHPYFYESPFPQPIALMPKFPVINKNLKKSQSSTLTLNNNSNTTTTTTSTTNSHAK